MSINKAELAISKKNQKHTVWNLYLLPNDVQKYLVIFCVHMRVSTLTALMYSVLRTEGLVGKRIFELFGRWL